MATFIHTGYEPITKRDLFVIKATHPHEVGEGLSFPSRYFACLLAWDTVSADDADVTELATKLLKAGCVYICCWGPGCERVHDLFDTIDIDQRPDGPIVMSTWHADEPLSDALRFLLCDSHPDDVYCDECRSAVGIAIGAQAWANEMRDAFTAPQDFNTRWLSGKH